MSAHTSSIKYIFIPWTVSCFLFCLPSWTTFASHAEPLVPAPISRKILVLYNSQKGQTATKNPFFWTSQSVLNHEGILTDYADVALRPLPGPETMSKYRGIVAWFEFDSMKAPKPYVEWLGKQLKANRKIVILGNLGCAADERRDPVLKRVADNVFRLLGLSRGGNYTNLLIRYDRKRKEAVEFEKKYPPIPPQYSRFKPVDERVDTLLSIRRQNIRDSESSVIATGPHGGFAYQGYIYWQEPVQPYRRRWYLNPFHFFGNALGLECLPKPDPTTLNGLRVALSHIDGDSFGEISHIGKNASCGEIVRDHILKKYDFPVTVSVIAGEIDPKAAGSAGRVRLAREIFSLANVEPASHSYSHPFYWDPAYQNKEVYGRHYGVKIPGYDFDSGTEIDYSMQYITHTLSPPEKPCKVFLWTGNCVPMISDIARCDDAGYLNMNGGDTLFDKFHDSHTSVAPLYRKVGGRFQIHCGQSNENILTNLWTGPYFGHRGIIVTMKNTGYPRRMKPIDIYYHFYSGKYHASLKAIQDIYEWVMRQEIAPVFASEYIQMVRGYLGARLYSLGPDRYAIEDYGHCLSVRFDAANKTPDLSRCENVLGYVHEPQGLYVSLVPGKKRAEIVLSGEAVSRTGHLKKATGWISGFIAERGRINMNYRGFGKNGMIEIGGLKPEARFFLKGSALNGNSLGVISDKRGIAIIRDLKTGSIMIASGESQGEP